MLTQDLVNYTSIILIRLFITLLKTALQMSTRMSGIALHLKKFPVAIGLAVNNTEDNDRLKDHCLQLSKKIPSGGVNWINQSVYNTDRTHNIIDDEIFAPINTWVEEQVNLYAKELKFKNSCKLQEGWFSIYNKGASQEYHTHPGYIFSCVYTSSIRHPLI